MCACSPTTPSKTGHPHGNRQQEAHDARSRVTTFGIGMALVLSGVARLRRRASSAEPGGCRADIRRDVDERPFSVPGQLLPDDRRQLASSAHAQLAVQWAILVIIFDAGASYDSAPSFFISLPSNLEPR